MAAAVVDNRGMDSPSAFSESQADTDDIVFPCKGCGEILEEGKAFELAGNRWHIDCFRCNTCGTLLDSDANLLLLGDGSLICNNCTYSCSACNNKIEDLAILTGDQAFCSACFRCRNCKRKIENLRYARTSQGIFCMSCHESLMARRRKKGSKSAKPAQNGPAPVKEKALPSLPPGAVPSSAFSPEVETPPSETYPGTPGATRSPPERSYYPPQRTLSSRGAGAKRDVSPMSDDARRDGPTLPASTYGDRRPSNVTEDSDDGEERGFLPMAFDPNPVAPPPIARKAVPRPSDSSPPANDGRPPPDYFTRAPKSAAREAKKEEEEERARSVSTEREPERTIPPSKQSPHILYQEKGRSRKRETSGNNTPASISGAASPLVGAAQDKTKPQQVEAGDPSVSPNDGFRVQEVPKSKKAASRSNSKAESPSLVSPATPSLNEASSKDTRSDIARSNSPVSLNSQNSGVNPFDDPKRREAGGSAPAPPRPVRGDSLAPGAHKVKQPSPTDPTAPSSVKKAHSVHGRQESTNSANFVDAKSTQSREDGGPKSVESPQAMRQSFDAPPPRSSSRPNPAQGKAADNFTAPRAPPPPPLASMSAHRANESVNSALSNEAKGSDGGMSPALRSAGLPKHSMEGSFSMEDEMTRIMRGEQRAQRQTGEGPTTSMMRKVSNAVKHGRSFSDRGLHSAGKSSSNGAIDIGSPMNISSPLLASPTGKESYDDLMSQLRRARARITELETDYGALESKMNSSTEIKAATNELREKRDTIVVLNTQREMVVRELEAMTDHLATAKDNSTPLDLPALKSELLKDFTQSLQKLKEEMSAEIEDLMHKRDQLTEEISKLIQMKDKGFQEYETLSSKNAQLQEMNNQVLSNIQDTYKANRVPSGGANGLGIYHPEPPPKSSESQASAEVRNLNLVSTDASMPDLLRETEAEPATVLTAPQVVNIRKGQPKKFNWRRGGERMAKNVTKGIKGAFVSERREGESPYGNISVPYAQAQQVGGSDQGSINSRQGLESGRAAGAGFGGLFGPKGAGLRPGQVGSMKNSSSTNLAAAAVDPSVLFGSDLEARCEYEKRLIPAIVTRCIEEVESRGMDMEGVYRKSGGSGLVKAIQLGFEKEGGGYDISDPDLDIHAVTSALKQYFRKLPDPLITYDVYETILAAGQEKDQEKQVLALKAAVQELPDRHRDVLEFLLQHLARVVELEAMNLMTPLNLAVVFAPTIMRPESIEREMSDMQAQRAVVQGLIEGWKEIFDE